jgi:CubicO group peptidase (beta-lactamase class C family)
VHDENARFLRGVSGNAGVFSDLSDMSAFVLMLANRGRLKETAFIDPALINESVQNHTKGLSESRGYGFAVKDEHPNPAGEIFSPGSYGHTGFTGTVFWVDVKTSFYTVLLSNRVHPTRENTKIVEYRKKLHNTCVSEYNERNHSL